MLNDGWISHSNSERNVDMRKTHEVHPLDQNTAQRPHSLAGAGAGRVAWVPTVVNDCISRWRALIAGRFASGARVGRWDVGRCKEKLFNPVRGHHCCLGTFVFVLCCRSVLAGICDSFGGNCSS